MPLPDTANVANAGAEASQASGDAQAPKVPAEGQSQQNPEQVAGDVEEVKAPGGLSKPGSVVRNFNVNNLETF